MPVSGKNNIKNFWLKHYKDYPNLSEKEVKFILETYYKYLKAEISKNKITNFNLLNLGYFGVEEYRAKRELSIEKPDKVKPERWNEARIMFKEYLDRLENQRSHKNRVQKLKAEYLKAKENGSNIR